MKPLFARPSLWRQTMRSAADSTSLWTYKERIHLRQKEKLLAPCKATSKLIPALIPASGDFKAGNREHNNSNREWRRFQQIDLPQRILVDRLPVAMFLPDSIHTTTRLRRRSWREEDLATYV
jgi:hypothetical protein